jgi:ketosteroid isomerase-like protein
VEDGAKSNKAFIRGWIERRNHRKAGEPISFEGFSPEFRWTIIGNTPISGTTVGAGALSARMEPFRKRIQWLSVHLDALVADGDRVIALAHSEGRSISGHAYENRYATAYRFSDGEVVEVIEHLDTALIETAVFGRELSDVTGNPNEHGAEGPSS